MILKSRNPFEKMNDSRALRALLAGTAFTTIVAVCPAYGQAESMPALVDKGLLAMKAKKWPEALQIHTEIVNRFGKNNPLRIYGPRFGNLYYRKGICELKLKKWDAAIQSFENCHKNFPNKGTEGGGNQFENIAVYRKGEAQMGAEAWEEAIKSFETFLKIRDKARDRYHRGNFHLSLAICHYKLRSIPKGNEQLEIAIKNKKEYKTPETGIVSAFQNLVEAAIEKENEQAIVDFVQNNRGTLIIPPYAMYQFSPVFMRLAAEAIAADMQRASVVLYQFVPPTETAVEGVRTKLTSLGNIRGLKDGERNIIKSELENNLKNFDESRRSPKSSEMIKLISMAFIQEKNGNFRGAYAAYRLLEKYYQNSDKREDNLFNLVRTSSIVAAGVTTQEYGELFLKTYPNSKHVPAVKRMMLSSLFLEGEYKVCIEVAEPMLPKLQEGTPQHDICLHVLGGSFFYTGQYDKAQPLLDNHVETHPESDFEIAAGYFQGSNLTRLQFWTKAGKTLDGFLEKYADPSKNVYYPFALYDRANSHYALEEHEPAMEILNRIIDEFPDCDVIDQSWNLRGNVEQTIGERDKAEESYLKALEIAERRKNDVIAGESLFSLVALLGDKQKNEDRLKDAVPFADKYWEKYSLVAPYNARVAVAQVAPLVAVERSEEALERLKDVIIELAATPQAFGLEELINSYKDAYLVDHSPEQLKEHFFNFPIPARQRAARALLRIAVIAVFEEMAKKAENEQEERDAKAGIQVLFAQLKADFDVKDLSNYILVRVGDFLRTNTATPMEALPYYNEALSRDDQSFRFNALLGRADVYGMSSNPAEIDKGLADFRRIYEDTTEKSQKEFSLYRIVELLMAKKDYAGAEKEAKIYLDRETNGFSKYSADVQLMLAKSFDARKMTNDAFAVYSTLATGPNMMGNISKSAPAMKRYMEIYWSRNEPAKDKFSKSSRQAAYDQGNTYIELTSRFKDKFTDEELELWKEVEKLVKNYEADPKVKSKKQQEAEKKD